MGLSCADTTQAHNGEKDERNDGEGTRATIQVERFV